MAKFTLEAGEVWRRKLDRVADALTELLNDAYVLNAGELDLRR